MEKVGRNDPCPCGSGKKFKKCCGAKDKKRTFQATVMPSSNLKIPNVFQSNAPSLIGRVSAPTTPQPTTPPTPQEEEKKENTPPPNEEEKKEDSF